MEYVGVLLLVFKYDVLIELDAPPRCRTRIVIVGSGRSGNGGDTKLDCYVAPAGFALHFSFDYLNSLYTGGIFPLIKDKFYCQKCNAALNYLEGILNFNYI